MAEIFKTEFIIEYFYLNRHIQSPTEQIPPAHRKRHVSIIEGKPSHPYILNYAEGKKIREQGCASIAH